ncbi:MAG: N-acetylmuramoyl-L-alanine amidase [Syntrophales bacterium]|nr:N-acetylmuramoyl-L-alanine amidase [Syntrophales bacterium]
MRDCKNIWLYLLVVLLLCGAGDVLAQEKHVVILDAAHGGQDHGVQVTDKVVEKDLTLKLALLVQRELQQSAGVRVVLTRGADEDITTTERVKKINAQPAKMMISIHVNAGFFKDARGCEVYFPGFKNITTAKDESSAIIGDMTKTRHLNESVRLAQILQRNLETIFPKESRGLREAPMAIFEGISVPAVAVEIGFATNPDNRKKLLDERTQQEIARAVAKSIRESLNI